jgi:hypothetical protein
MPYRLEIESLQAELNAISGLIEEAKKAHDTIGILQFENRKQEIEKQIEELNREVVYQANVALFFKGGPVIDSRGISVSFAGDALRQFQDIINTQLASVELGELGKRGPIPDQHHNSLMITDVTHGSFGFLLNEIDDQVTFVESNLKQTLDEVLVIINATSAIKEEEFFEAIQRLDQRTLIALKEFFLNLDSSAATMRIVGDKLDFSMDEEAVHRARLRTEATKIEEQDITVSGILLGFLPEHRRFELKLETGETISGSATIESAEQIWLAIDEGRSVSGTKCVVSINKRMVKPFNQPERFVYRLIEFKKLGD